MKVYYIILFVLLHLTSGAQMIDDILLYQPAPGQFINQENIGTLEAADRLTLSNMSIISLGACGGFIEMKLAKSIENNPRNPYGVDFVIYGNAFSGLSEPGIIYIMADDNHNGKADEEWYLIAGSDYFFSSTTEKYNLTYINPKAPTAQDVYWHDNQGNKGAVRANNFHKQPYYPDTMGFPQYPRDSVSFTLHAIRGFIDSTSQIKKSFARRWGYADNKPRGNPQASKPANPYTKVNSGLGGDGIDISWAVDTEGNYVDLTEISFIKIVTGVNYSIGSAGEISTEVSAIIDVIPDTTATEDQYGITIEELPITSNKTTHALHIFTFTNGRIDAHPYTLDIQPDTYVISGDSIFFQENGIYTIKAMLDEHSERYDEISIEIVKEDVALPPLLSLETIEVYPNPVSNVLHFAQPITGILQIINMQGKVIWSIQVEYTSHLRLPEIESGYYRLNIIHENTVLQCSIIKY